MMLPQMQYPVYEVKLLSSPVPLKFRPFTVREEKIMRMGLEGGDAESIVNALKAIIENCVIDKFDADNMAMVDMETLFLHMRARSIGELGNQFFKCKNDITVALADGNTATKECGMLIDVPIKFLEVPIINSDKSRDIRLADDLGVTMKYPTLGLSRLIATANPDDIEVLVVAHCIDTIYTKEEVYKAADAKPDEVVNFVLSLPTDKYDLIKDFALNTPRNRLIVEKTCTKCGYDHKITLEGIQDFFE